MEAEIGVGRRACAHPGHYSRVYISMEKAFEAGNLAKDAIKKIDR